MCGIAGIVSKNIRDADLRLMDQLLSHRGPDAQGVFREENIALVHRRLSIIDLSAEANQPFFSSDGKWVIVFNGEVYNYKELKKGLETRGYQFRTHCDTEVIIAAIEQQGMNAVQQFIGMFALALYNRHTKELFIVRDRVGVKPLYYYKDENTLAFASEIRALAALGEIDKEIDQDAVVDFLRFGYIRAPRSVYKKIKKLLPGSYLKIKDEKIELINYWNLEKVVADKMVATKTNHETVVDELEEIMGNAANYRMVADVPIGVFLSGGIDSSLLTALLRKKGNELKTFSIGFDEAEYNEAPFAANIAKHLGTKHHEQILPKNELLLMIDKYFETYDEPYADSSGIPTYLVSRFAAQNGCKVVLSADGGDELFGGYTRYIDFPLQHKRLARLNNFFLRSAIQIVSKTTSSINYKNTGHRFEKLTEVLEEFPGNFSPGFYEKLMSVASGKKIAKIAENQPAAASLFFTRYAADSLSGLAAPDVMALWDFTYYLPDDLLVKIDRATMHNSIEGREPFLDHRLIEFAFSLHPSLKYRSGAGKDILKNLLERFVPRELFERKKQGFSIPLYQTIHNRLEKDFNEWFSEKVFDKIPFLNSKAIKQEFNRFLFFKKKGEESNVLFMWHLYCLIKWWMKWGR